MKAVRAHVVYQSGVEENRNDISTARRAAGCSGRINAYQ
jgi:hypothetical protein